MIKSRDLHYDEYITENELQQYEVQSILGRKSCKGGLMYLVKWKGYDLSQSTWQPFTHLANSFEFVRQYERKMSMYIPSARNSSGFNTSAKTLNKNKRIKRFRRKQVFNQHLIFPSSRNIKNERQIQQYNSESHFRAISKSKKVKSKNMQKILKLKKVFNPNSIMSSNQVRKMMNSRIGTYSENDEQKVQQFMILIDQIPSNDQLIIEEQSELKHRQIKHKLLSISNQEQNYSCWEKQHIINQINEEKSKKIDKIRDQKRQKSYQQGILDKIQELANSLLADRSLDMYAQQIKNLKQQLTKQMEIHPYNPNNEFYIYDYKESCKKLLNQLDKSKTNEDNGEDERNKENEDAKSREVEDEERQSFQMEVSWQISSSVSQLEQQQENRIKLLNLNPN